jgi:hypothetical protein
LKRIPGIRPRFTRCKIVRPDGSVLEAWEMFVGERSYGRSNSRTALLKSWEARLEEAENGRPFAFRPMYRRAPHPDQRNAAAKRPQEKADRAKAPRKSA